MRDFIIIGQGIAGSVLAISLIEKGYTVLVINEPQLSKSSQVAAGIWNPVVFKRLTKSWLADELVPELNRFYKQAEQLFGTPLIHQRNIIKPFTEEQEKNLWHKKAKQENAFLDATTYTDFQLSKNDLTKNYSKVLMAGNLDVAVFLERTKKYLVQHQSYTAMNFDYDQLQITAEQVNYKNTIAKAIIFCEGHLISKNPFFKWIPMKPAKGETITIHCPDLMLEKSVFNKGIFILPLGEQLYKVGATYEWELLNDEPSPKGRTELEQKLQAVISVPYTIVKHEAGVRPSVIDRRPVVGAHPELKNVFIFNGLGTKGVMLAPYFSAEFINNFTYGKPLHPEVDPGRFYKK